VGRDGVLWRMELSDPFSGEEWSRRSALRSFLSKAPLSSQRRHDWCSRLTCSRAGRASVVDYFFFLGRLQRILALLGFTELRSASVRRLYLRCSTVVPLSLRLTE
jgi:hypothetical protein